MQQTNTGQHEAKMKEEMQGHRKAAGLFILIDALGWTYLQNENFVTDILSYRTKVQTILGFSSGAIPVLLSGKPPKENGHWNLFYYDPENSPFRWVRWIQFLPSSLLNHRIFRKSVRELSRLFNRFAGYFQIYGVPVELLPYFDICEKSDIYLPGGLPNSIFDHLKACDVPYRTYSYHQFSDRQIISEASSDLRAQKYEMYFLYLSELDSFLHDRCKYEGEVRSKLQQYDRWIREVYQEAKKSYGDVELFVFSDHGMTPKRAGYDLLSEIRPLKLQMPRDYIAIYDSTMARFWYFQDDARTRILSRLKQLECGRILQQEERNRFGLDFSDNRYGDTIFLMNPGVVIEPSFMGTLGPEGMHGFDPEKDPHSYAAFLSNRTPEFPVRTLADVNEVMRNWIDRMGANRFAEERTNSSFAVSK
jgi:hypothetical protein